MVAGTHSVAGLMFILGCAVFLGFKFSIPIVLFAILGALLPDIDTGASWISKACPPLSRWVERKWAHRTITHSFIGFTAVGILSSPLILWNEAIWKGFLVGYLSHLLVDCINKSGVALFWPAQTRAIIPGKDSLRIKHGSTKEYIFAGFMGFACLGLIYVYSYGGLMKWFHHIFATPKAAVSDYVDWADEWKVYARLNGVDMKTYKKIDGVYPVIGILGRTNLLVDIDGHYYVVTQGGGANIYPRKVTCMKKEPIKTATRHIKMDDRLLREIELFIDPEKENYLFGDLVLAKMISLPKRPNVYPPVSSGGRILKLDFATMDQIKKFQLGDVPVKTGTLLIKTFYKPGEEIEIVRDEFAVASLKVAPKVSASSVYTIKNVKKLLVGRGSVVKAGDPLAEIYLTGSTNPGSLEYLEKDLALAREKKNLILIEADNDIKGYQEEISELKEEKGALGGSLFAKGGETVDKKIKELERKLRSAEIRKREQISRISLEIEKKKIKVDKVKETGDERFVRARRDAVVASITESIVNEVLNCKIELIISGEEVGESSVVTTEEGEKESPTEGESEEEERNELEEVEKVITIMGG